jgi:hypothetical protein
VRTKIPPISKYSNFVTLISKALDWTRRAQSMDLWQWSAMARTMPQRLRLCRINYRIAVGVA